MSIFSKKNFFSNYKIISFLIFLYISVLLGFLLDENSSGGAFLDYINQKQITSFFAKDFLSTFLNYDSYTTRHSPVLLIIISLFEKMQLNDYCIRLIYFHICLILPVSFFYILKYNFKNQQLEIKYFLILVGLIFLSPIFRSLSIWPDSRLIGLTFFTTSILFFYKFFEKKKIIFIFLNIFFYTISSYFSPNFAIFSIYFVYKYFKFFGIGSLKFYIIIVFNLILSFPALYYIFVLDINFFNKSAAIGLGKVDSIFFTNISNQILIIPSIIFFYFLPFYTTKILSVKKLISYKNLLITSIIFTISLFYFDYKPEYSGGGIIYKLSDYLLNNNILFFIFSYISIMFIMSIILDKIDNFLIILLIIISNPQITIYHKYYDPLLIILFFSLFVLNVNLEHLKNFKKILFLYLYFFGFLLANILKSNI
tara:strand:+ start:6400 stop:7671 length:1272 start_codon:yes stop_codon:yes gene_type:complete